MQRFLCVGAMLAVLTLVPAAGAAAQDTTTVAWPDPPAAAVEATTVCGDNTVQGCVDIVMEAVGNLCPAVSTTEFASTAASVISVCGMEPADVEPLVMALVSQIADTACGIAGGSVGTMSAASVISICGIEPVDLAHLVTQKLDEACGGSTADCVTKVETMRDMVLALVPSLIQSACGGREYMDCYARIVGLVGGVPSAQAAYDARVEAQLELDVVDETIAQLPTCEVSIVPPRQSFALASPPELNPVVDVCLDEAGALEPPAILGPKAAAARSAGYSVGLSRGTYCQTNEENDPEDEPEDRDGSDPLVWASIRGFGRSPKSFIIGNCHDSWGASIDKEDAGEGMAAGSFGGEFAGCGYINRGNLADPSEGEGTGGAGYPCSSYPKFRQFGALFNCSNKLAREKVRDPNTGEEKPKCNSRDGTSVSNDESCHRYFNVQPWLNPTKPGKELPFISDPNPPTTIQRDGKPALRFKWRYETRDHQYVLVKDAGRASGQGRWLFVNRSCLPDTLPGPNVTPDQLYEDD